MESPPFVHRSRSRRRPIAVIRVTRRSCGRAHPYAGCENQFENSAAFGRCRKRCAEHRPSKNASPANLPSLHRRRRTAWYSTSSHVPEGVLGTHSQLRSSCKRNHVRIVVRDMARTSYNFVWAHGKQRITFRGTTSWLDGERG